MIHPLEWEAGRRAQAAFELSQQHNNLLKEDTDKLADVALTLMHAVALIRSKI